MAESAIEKSLVKEVESLGGLCKKWVSPGWAGAPDRIVLLPGGKIFFVELKNTGEKLRKQQAYRARQLTELGQQCRKVDSYEAIAIFIREVKSYDL